MGPGTSTRSDQLATAIRRRIVSGEYSPGNRLPTFQEIETDFSVSRGVAQIAIERLKKDGFVSSASRQGLFVVRNPPHLRRYALVFPVTHANPAWSRFDEVLVREARVLQQAGAGREFEVFAGIDDFRDGPDVMRRLRRDVLNDRLAGLILTPDCFQLAEEEPFSDPDLPKVFIFRQDESPETLSVNGDGDSILHRGLGQLAQQGCHRVAVIRIYGTHSNLCERHFTDAGLEFHPQWVQVIGRGDTAVLSTLLPLLMDYPAEQRPDGLFILDDNLTDHVIAAIVSMGLQIGKDLKVVSHSNWPCRAPCVLPMRRIGYHVGEMLTRCVDAIDLTRQGKHAPSVQHVRATFEDELDPETTGRTYQ